MNPQNQKSLDLYQYSWKNQETKSRPKNWSQRERENQKLLWNLSNLRFKLKPNVIGENIMKKTRNLTQNHTWTDPIDRRIKEFSFLHFEDEFRHSRDDSPQFSLKNLTFKHFLDAKIDLWDEESKRINHWDV